MSSAHMHREIEGLKRRILTVGAMVEQAIAQAISALARNDAALSRSVIEHDSEVDRMEIEVEEECLKILALYQPVAGDLRFVIAVLKMNNDLERMADLAVNIATRALRLGKLGEIRPPGDLPEMAQKAKGMVKKSLDALVQSDTTLAREVCDADDILDAMRSDFHTRIMEQIREHPEQVESLLNLHAVTRHLERLGDMATNVAEDVIYMVDGDIVRHPALREPTNTPK
ncbi:MAG: Phosphate-specific transport system accessory protein PhoU [Phycisphaerae bacterium]|nr:Phosphate-specific transport system accessory protein PhoU [Phycisphaerae bacterium]